MSTILVVEDNDLNRQLFTDLLEMGGHDVRTCTTAEDGLRIARLQRPDLVLMDIQLPGMDGLEAVRQLRADPEIAGVKCVALTAQAMRGDQDMAVQAGFDGYITKPIDTRRFVQEVSAYTPPMEPAR